MFLTSVSFGETSITFTPFLAEIREVIKDFQDQMITTVHQVYCTVVYGTVPHNR